MKVTEFWLSEYYFSSTLVNWTWYSPLHLSQPTCFQAFASLQLLLFKNKELRYKS